jgi:para-nitrobenzyl esterase
MLGTSVLTAAGCADPCSLTAMRALSTDDLIKGTSMLQAVASGWIPSVDTQLMTMEVGAAFAAGTYQKVPIIEGSNHDEYRLFVGSSEMAPASAPVGPLTADTYLKSMTSTFGDMAGAALASVYPVSAYPKCRFGRSERGHRRSLRLPHATRCASALCARNFNSYEFNDQKAPQLFLAPVPDFAYAAAHARRMSWVQIGCADD